MGKHLPRLRQRINHPAKHSMVESIHLIHQKLEEEEGRLEGSIDSNRVKIILPKNERRLWSPQMRFLFTPDELEERAYIHGFVGPNPTVWIYFKTICIALGLIGILLSVIAAKKWMYEHDPILLWSIPITLLLVSTSILTSILGQRLSKDQTDVLNGFLDDIIDDQGPKALVRAGEVSKFLKIDSLDKLGDMISIGLLRLLKLNQINKIYVSLAHLPAKSFIRGVLTKMKVKYRVYDKDLNRIPLKGPAILVSNHPTILDGPILFDLFFQHRDDVKMLGNFLMHRIEPLQDFILPVNPFEQYKDAKSSLSGIKLAIQHLREGGLLSVFPAGEISMLDENGDTRDREWQESAMKLIKKAGVPIIPVYFDGKNSPLFYFLASLRDSFRTAMLPREMLNKQNREMTVRIGYPIPVELQKNIENLEDFTRLLRTKTYLLGKGIPKERTGLKKFKPLRSIQVAPPVPEELIKKDINACKQSKGLLFSYHNFDVFLTTNDQSPNLVREIGRLREITFREIGEGTRKALDLDKYDKYYKHLILYDNDVEKIIGAYRLGIGKIIFENKGVEGFYINDLFAFSPEFHPFLKKSIDMGRAFIVRSHQRSHMGLYLLWKGISFVIHLENAEYLIGGVSISNEFSPFCKSVMVEWLRKNYFDPDLARYVRERRPFKPDLLDQEKAIIDKILAYDLKTTDKFIDEIEPEFGKRIPVLMKKYIAQNGRFLGFNIDPEFNNVVDGLMLGKINEFPPQTMAEGKNALEEYKNMHGC